MFKNYFKTAWRHLWRNKTFSLINILGLSLGTASALLIIFHVKQELSYDKGFTKANRIFRVTQEGLDDDSRHWAATPFTLGSTLQTEMPGVESIARFHRPYPYIVFSYTPQQGEVKRFEEKGGFFADQNVVNLFDLSFTRGDARTALTEINTVILTEAMATRYFGKEDPLGKTILDDVQKFPMKVSGVVKAMPGNTHLKFDYLLSMPTIYRYIDQQSLERRTWNGFYTYVLLNKKEARKQVEAQMPALLAKYLAEPGVTAAEINASTRLNLQPITSIHLHSKLEKEMYANSDITYIYIFSVAALFILLVAAVNFINMSTAQAFNRMREIGLRKVIGATKKGLIGQFMGESFLSTLLATVLALVLFKMAIPFYNELAGKNFQFEELFSWTNMALLLGLVLAVGVLSGLYPAWFVANFNPVTSLKGKKLDNSSVTTVRKGLIVFQFVVAVFMIFSTVIVYQQMRLFHNKKLGFDKEQVLAVTMYPEMWNSFGAFSTALSQNKSVSGYSIISTLPGDRFSMESFGPVSSTDKDQKQGTRVMFSDEKLLSTLQITLKEGRNFFNQFPEIKQPEFIINESAVKLFKLTNPLGTRVSLNRDTGTIVGVVKDFNFASLHAPVEPLAIEYHPYRANYLLVKVQPNQLPATLNMLESTIKKLSPSSVFTYTFMDEKMDLLYASENRMSQVFKVFAGFALFISCLGLFALSAFSARLRIKEVGIRKVLGASVTNVTMLLGSDFIRLVLLATVIALPIAWYAMSQWLDGFAYRVSIGVGVFVLSAAAALFLGAMTVSLQAIKAALINPVQSLKE